MNEQKQFQEKFNQLSEVEKNDIYRAVLYEYVREDADYRSEWLGIEALSDEHLGKLPPTLLAQNVTSDKGYSAFIIIRNSRVSGFH